MVIQNGSKFKTSLVNVAMSQVPISKLPRNMQLFGHTDSKSMNHRNSGFNPALTFLYKPFPKNLVQ